MKINRLERERRSALRKSLSEKLDRLTQSVKDAEYGVSLGNLAPAQLEFAKGMLAEVREGMFKLNRGVSKQRAWVRGREF